jgi:all-trans-retinol dehydrogenase (NAD+)
MRVAGCRTFAPRAAQGLGFAIASAFAARGANVVLTDLDASKVAESAAQIPRAAGYALDVTKPEQIADVRAKLLAEHGPPDVLVNNAGVVFGGPFADVPLAKHLATINVNLAGLVAVTHAFLPDLLARPKAHVVNIASASAVIALPLGTTYAATKWAVLGFTESLIEELRLQGVHHLRATAMCPSYIRTGLFAGVQPVGFGKWLTPEVVAAATVRAVERDREFVMLPFTLRLGYALLAGLPRGLNKWVCRRLGVSTSMMNWQGHAR